MKMVYITLVGSHSQPPAKKRQTVDSACRPGLHAICRTHPPHPPAPSLASYCTAPFDSTTNTASRRTRRGYDGGVGMACAEEHYIPEPKFNTCIFATSVPPHDAFSNNSKMRCHDPVPTKVLKHASASGEESVLTRRRRSSHVH